MVPLAETVLDEEAGFRRVAFTEVSGGYELEWIDGYFGQAVGDCWGIVFSFHAKHGSWDFATEDETGHPFPPEHPSAFRRSGRYKALTMEWTIRTLQRCLAEMCGNPV